eukprot:Nk52_evm2s273 gene=Nk52_evmTU2s273
METVFISYAVTTWLDRSIMAVYKLTQGVCPVENADLGITSCAMGEIIKILGGIFYLKEWFMPAKFVSVAQGAALYVTLTDEFFRRLGMTMKHKQYAHFFIDSNVHPFILNLIYPLITRISAIGNHLPTQDDYSAIETSAVKALVTLSLLILMTLMISSQKRWFFEKENKSLHQP